MFTKSKTLSVLFSSLLLSFIFYVCVFALSVSPSEARNITQGNTVTVTGYAYSATDTVGTGFKNEFYLSDTFARGICVEVPENEKISLYKEYSVTGTLQKSNGELKLLSTEITSLNGETVRKVKRLSFSEALDYETNGGTFAKLSGEARNPVTHRGLLSSFTLTKDSEEIRVIIESDVYSLLKGEKGKTELTEDLRYKRNVTVNGFISKIGTETVIRIKDCDDIDVQYHICKFGEAVTEKKPTCNTPGLSVKVCDCGMREETSIPALSHQFYEETERASTCTTPGLNVKKCRNCSFREETSIPLKEHSFAEKTETPASCDKNGVYLRYCKNCTLREETLIPKTDHKFKEKTDKEPTCTKEGVKVKYCSDCSFREEIVLPKTDHSYKKKTDKATFTVDGSMSEVCSDCGDKKNITVIAAASDIRLSEESFVFDGKTHKPTVTIKDKDGKTVTDFDLICESRKEIGKHSLTVELKGNYSGRKTLYYTVIPTNVTDVKAAVISKGVTLTFNESKGADGYRIYYIKGTKEESLGTFSGTSCSVILPQCGKTYTLLIRAYKKADDTTLWSKGVYFNISTGPDDVTGIKSESNFYSVKLSWDKTENADGYRVYIEKDNGKYKILTTTTNTSFSVTGLSADTKYNFAIKAYRKADGKTLWGKTSKKTASTTSGKPSTFSGKESYNSVALSWREVKGSDGYKVYVYSSTKKRYTTLKSVTDNKYTAEELKSGTTYKFAMKPYAKKNGKTYYGTPVYLTVTTKLTKPTLTAKITAKGNTLSWNKVNGADGYILCYCNEKDGSYKKIKTTTATSYTHSKASKSKPCYYKVRAYKTVNGKKIYSSFSTVKKAVR